MLTRACVIALLIACRPASPPASAPGPQRFWLETPVQLTTDAGCEEFPSFTPDGTTIVYDHTLDHGFSVFALDVATKKKERLSMQAETVWDYWERWDYAPAVSPDGKRIAHLRDESAGTELRVMPVLGDSHGDPVSLGVVADAEPLWRDDQTLVALGKNNEILAIDADTGERKVLLTVTSEFEVYGFLRLADGALGLRLARADSNMRHFSLGVMQWGATYFELLPLEDGFVEPLRFKGGVASPLYSGLYQARGNRLDDATLVYRDAHGGKAEIVARVPATMGFSIAPDRKSVVYSACYEYGSVARIERGKPIVELTPRSADIIFDVRRANATTAVFTAIGSNTSAVRTIDPKTKKITETELGNAAEARYSAKGDAIVFVRHDGQRGAGLVFRRVDDGREAKITDEAEDNAPAFSHDGKHVLFLRGARIGEGATLHRVALNGTPPVALPFGAVTAFAASPTADVVVFATVEEPTLFLTDLFGATPRPLLVSGGKGSFQDLSFSPDGKHLAIIRGQKELLELQVDDIKREPVLIADSGFFGLRAVDYSPDGKSFLAALRIWDGDLWIARGFLP